MRAAIADARRARVGGVVGFDPLGTRGEFEQVIGWVAGHWTLGAQLGASVLVAGEVGKAIRLTGQDLLTATDTRSCSIAVPLPAGARTVAFELRYLYETGPATQFFFGVVANTFSFSVTSTDNVAATPGWQTLRKTLATGDITGSLGVRIGRNAVGAGADLLVDSLRIAIL